MAFLGSPEEAATCLAALHEAGHDVAVVVSGADKRRGRGSTTSPTPVKQLARQLGLPVADQLSAALDVAVDIAVVVAFGHIIPAAALERLLFVNVHFSLLPRWRGAAPVERAILAGDDLTGVCLMKLDEGLDTGPVFGRAVTAILPGETAASLRRRLAVIGADLLLTSLTGGVAGLGSPRPQAGEPTYAVKLGPLDRRIDWSRSAGQVERQVRVGRAWTTFRGRRVIVWDAVAESSPRAALLPPGALAGDLVATGDGWLHLSVVQIEGRPRQNVAEWLRGMRLQPTEALV
ncbi:MAG: methionyl-tRNA formyltransferase [Acidimicrobiales bacterium]